MKAVRKILVPMDFSEASRNALDYAAALAERLGAALIVAHIVEYSERLAYAFPDETFELQKEQAAGARTALKDAIPEELRDSLTHRSIVKIGVVSDELLAIMADESPDLVVMGTHGRRGFSRWMLGSVTERLLRKVPLALLTVPHLEADVSAPKLAPERILYATDLTETAGAGLDAAYDWAQKFDSELAVLHVMLPLHTEYGATYLPMDIAADHNALRNGLSSQLEQSIPELMRLDRKVRWELREGVPYEAILDFAGAWSADLIVIQLHGRSPMERTLIGSTAERVVRGSPVPVLAIPLPAPTP